MIRRVSIGRLMVAIGLTALAMTLLREWLGPRNFLGPLGPMAMLVLLGVVAMIVTAGRGRRFFEGLTATASALAIAILLAPGTILGSTFDYIVLPVDRWLDPRPSSPGLARLELMVLWEELGELHACNKPSIWCLGDRVWCREEIFCHSTEFQSWLMIPHAALAAIGGLVVMILRDRPGSGVCALEADLPSPPSAFPSLSDRP